MSSSSSSNSNMIHTNSNTTTTSFAIHPKPGRVFVGNIPQLATEAELAEELSVFGPVVAFKLVVDRDTGRHRGYGFCEFRDEETALSAKRNQEGLVSKGRQLRMDVAHTAAEWRQTLALKQAIKGDPLYKGSCPHQWGSSV